MGSSPSSNYEQPAQQGPPISELNPAQGPPAYPSFINGTGPQTGLTPEMLAGIQTNMGPGPMTQPAAGAGGITPNERQQLAQLIAAQQSPPVRRANQMDDWRNRGLGGGGSAGGRGGSAGGGGWGGH